MSDFLLITTLAELSNKKEFGFNGNFLEANVINIALLLSGVIYLGRNFLTSALETRQQKIVEVMQESEERLTQANERLKEAEKQLAEAKLAISKIKEERSRVPVRGLCLGRSSRLSNRTSLALLLTNNPPCLRQCRAASVIDVVLSLSHYWIV